MAVLLMCLHKEGQRAESRCHRPSSDGHSRFEDRQPGQDCASRRDGCSAGYDDGPQRFVPNAGGVFVLETTGHLLGPIDLAMNLGR
jgi:hypothetical protein